ncbi:Peptide-N4-(N-acetyl-beta-glucosaminyl)asparagine amidase A [Dichanthelium oligosanthes]|uniref:Peptide-N4-(N-acetyl-beta-glucosaminyl)asparagine amidase A n=1 Tax=Dichanthelium oligosanthes TaxID=888268 RepID=A0A1E5USI1_9POAL|nr:Peptide-N4-(N-acetyl-beta-glucosaminyl)asparagine amidase A [Dichanthelium oligosanthes]
MPLRAPPHRLLLLLVLLVPALADVPDRYSSPRPGASAGARLGNAPAQEYLDPTYPAPRPPPSTPSCVVPVLSYSFANTYGAPPATAAYAPPAGCPAPWSLVALSFSAAVAGDQYDRVAAVWLDGAELLRTTTAEPTPDGIRWTVRKDVTRHSAQLRSPPGGVLSVMLENLVNDQYTGVYNVSVSLEFHGAPAYLFDAGSSAGAGAVDSNPPTPTLPQSYFQPADLILPISEATGNSSGFWFRIQNSSDSRSKLVTIPSNTYRAVLEVFVSPHSNDEFWYSNPPDLYIRENNLTTARGNAAYREVVVSVDRHCAGSFVPFPVIYTGGINPLFWQPVAALGAFDLPTYDVELTPFLGLLVDGKAHEIALSVVDGIAEWLVDANLHLWLDPASSSVSAALGRYRTPRLSITRRYHSRLLDGSFQIRAKRKSRLSGWVKSSFGNFTTEVETEVEASSLVEFTNQGRNKTVRLQAEQGTEITVRSSETWKEVGKVETEAKFPLWLEMVTEDGENGTYVMRANLTHSLRVETDAEAERLFERETKLADEQAAAGWMLVRDHDVLDGSAATVQAYRYSDDAGRYERAIDTLDGAVLSDNVTESYRVLNLNAVASPNARCRGRRCNGVVAAKCSDIAAM